jgi:hypothetical protein
MNKLQIKPLSVLAIKKKPTVTKNILNWDILDICTTL